MLQNFKKWNSSVMEAETISKNAASLKSLTSRGNQKLILILLCTFSVFYSGNLYARGPIKNFNKTNQINSVPFGKEAMEFIGFKNRTNKKQMDHLLDGFGNRLEGAHIAVNKSDFYLGIYSFDELQLYKSTKKYVSFVDVDEFIYSFNDNYAYKSGMMFAGIYLTCFGILPIGIPLWVAANPNKTQMHLKGEMKLYLYDTQKKEIVLATPLSFNYTDYYKGQYFHSKTDKEKIDNYYKIFLANLLLEKYVAMDNFIKNINE